MTALLDLDATVALAHAVALAEEAAAALADVPIHEAHGPGIGDLLLRLRGVQRRLDAAGSVMTQRFADSPEWEMDGARNAVSWLHGRGHDSLSESRRTLERGALVRDFPSVAEAWRSGEISGAHIDAIARLHRRYPRLHDALVAVDDAIAIVARECEPHNFFQRLRQLCHRMDPDAIDERDRQRATALHVSTLLDGFVRIDGTLDPVMGARFIAALESARRAVAPPEAPEGKPSPRDHRPVSQRNVEALGRILAAAGAASGDLALPLVSGERPTINVTVPIDALLDENSPEVGWLERFGIPTTVISGNAARRIACDSSLRPLVVDRQGRLVAMLPKARAIHPALRRAVFMRDQHCRFPGCRQRIDEVHHIVYHSRGGPTVLSNLVGLCWFHHHLVHDSGWCIEGDPGGELTFRSHHRRELTSDPPVF